MICSSINRITLFILARQTCSHRVPKFFGGISDSIYKHAPASHTLEDNWDIYPVITSNYEQVGEYF